MRGFYEFGAFKQVSMRDPSEASAGGSLKVLEGLDKGLEGFTVFFEAFTALLALDRFLEMLRSLLHDLGGQAGAT